MKSTKLLTIIVLVSLIILGMFSLIMSGDVEEKEELESVVAQARDYMKRELYQLAIGEYDEAIAMSDSVELRDAILDAYEKRYEESEVIISDYIMAAESAIDAFPDKEKYYITLANNYCRNNDYQSAYKTLKRAKKEGIESNKINTYYMEIKYSFEAKWYSFTKIKSCVSGIYPVSTSDMWGYIDETGERKKDYNYTFVSQLGDEGIRIMCSDKNILVDEKDIVRGKISFVPSDAGVFSEGFIAIKHDDKYGYYNSLGDYMFGEYIAASNFYQGKAAVSEKEGEWYFIDITGKKISDTKYEDIKLNLDGSYLKKNIMLAKTQGKYKLFDKDENRIGTFECDDVDVITDEELIAFKKNEKWGFVDLEGNIVLDVMFDNAKSFSNGLAAVCKEEKWGFADKDGNIVIECQFFDADYFNEKRNCFVKVSAGEWQMISLKVKF